MGTIIFTNTIRIGLADKRGISGGHRKRVNIGLEIVVDPAVIFLGEPTNGLAATSSRLMMSWTVFWLCFY